MTTRDHPHRKNHTTLVPRRAARLSAGRVDHALVAEVLSIKEAARLRAEGWVDGVRVVRMSTPTVRIGSDAGLFQRVCEAVRRDPSRVPTGQRS